MTWRNILILISKLKIRHIDENGDGNYQKPRENWLRNSPKISAVKFCLASDFGLQWIPYENESESLVIYEIDFTPHFSSF